MKYTEADISSPFTGHSDTVEEVCWINIFFKRINIFHGTSQWIYLKTSIYHVEFIHLWYYSLQQFSKSEVGLPSGSQSTSEGAQKEKKKWKTTWKYLTSRLANLHEGNGSIRNTYSERGERIWRKKTEEVRQWRLQKGCKGVHPFHLHLPVWVRIWI